MMTPGSSCGRGWKDWAFCMGFCTVFHFFLEILTHFIFR